jgi:hypothetical protein
MGVSTEGLLLVLGVLVVGCWLGLAQRYSLVEHFATPYFAFEKIPGGFDSPILRSSLWLFLALAALYPTGYWLLRRAYPLSRSGQLAGGVLFLVLPGLINVALYPAGALDVFNYLAYLKLTYSFHENPYLAVFEPHMPDPFGTSGFLLHVPLFYGPAWLVLTGVPARLAGFQDPLRCLVALKLFNLALLAVTAAGLARAQADSRRGWLAAYIFLANPLVLFEGVGNGHNDVLLAAFLVAAAVALRRRSALVGPLLAVSILVKFVTVGLAPLFLLVMLRQRWGWRRLAAAALLAVAVVLAFCQPFWAGGRMLPGLRNALATSQDMLHVSLTSLARQYLSTQGEHAALLPLLPQLADGLWVAGALLVLWGAWRGRSWEAAGVDTLLLIALLLTNFYPWYLIPVIALLALRHDALGWAFLATITALGLAYYPVYVWIWFNVDPPVLQGHLFLARFLTLPVVLYLALQPVRAALALAIAAARERRRIIPRPALQGRDSA